MRRLGLAESRTAGATCVTHIHFFGTNITPGSADHREILVCLHISAVYPGLIRTSCVRYKNVLKEGGRPEYPFKSHF
jgi:hypothetical protein